MGRRASNHAAIIPSLLTGTSRPTRILVADDDPVILRLLQVNFNLEGYEVYTATRGEEALEKAKEHLPDIILLDVMMPGVDGWEVCRRLKEDHATAAIPVIFLSARAQDQDRRRGYELGVVAYVTKPFDPGELIEVVQRSLSGTPEPQE
jgi:DNA-binding response OmpR family regulator